MGEAEGVLWLSTRLVGRGQDVFPDTPAPSFPRPGGEADPGVPLGGFPREGTWLLEACWGHPSRQSCQGWGNPFGGGSLPLTLLSASPPFPPHPPPPARPSPSVYLFLPSLFSWSLHLSLTHPDLSFFLALPSWLCVQDLSPGSRSLTFACRSVSLAASSPSLPSPWAPGHQPSGALLPVESSQLRLLLCPSPCLAHL